MMMKGEEWWMAGRPERENGVAGRRGGGPASRPGPPPLREGDYPLGISLDVSHTPKTGPELRK